MGTGVELTEEIVTKRVSLLEELLTDIDGHYGTMLGVRQRQGEAIWSSIASCQGYAYALSGAVGTYAVALDSARERVGYLQESLAETARTMRGLDESVQERLAALGQRIADGPPSGPGQCTPWDIPGTYTPPTEEQPGPSGPPPGSEVPSDDGTSTEVPAPPEPEPSPSPQPEPTPSGGNGSW